ncbi:MAG: tetratricopeptide repeat protein [Sphingomonas sp.]|nr:tetratricopeptide repeat protein [Sphingomonas sp.]
MNRPSRFATAISTLALAAVLSGCAAGGAKRASIFGSKIDRSNIGLATKAVAALESEQFAVAVELAERAVENTPNDAGFRALLGNCYFGAGRFASAEAAYHDSLSLIPSQPKLVLKLALVQIAQGKSFQALSLLNSARDSLDAADFGLAVALAGRADDAVAVLNHAARMTGADARVRQNLALAYGLSGNWAMARTVAAQDVAPEQLDMRIQKWMAMAVPSRPSDQVAALTGITPAADPGQPARLALKSAPSTERVAETVVPQIQPQPQSQPYHAAELPYSPPPALPEPLPQAEAAPAPVVAVAVQALIAPAPLPVISDLAPVEAVVVPAVAPKLPTSFEAPVQPASYIAISDTVRKAAARKRLPSGNSRSVVQLGAYGSPERVMVAWKDITRRYPALRDYTPMRARFDAPKGTVWRLSIKGFASQQEAVDRCELLQSRGGKCFVRSVAGDAPVQLASR